MGVRFRPGLPPPMLLGEARRLLRPGQSVAEIFFLLGRILETSNSDRDQRLDLMVSMLRRDNGRIAVAKVTEELEMSERHLERLSGQNLALSPKTFARIVRLQSVLRRFITSPEERLADTATDFGYVDQTHMGRDFTHFGGITPLQYRRSIADVGFVLESGCAPR